MPESVPEIFVALIGYFEANSDLLKTETIFRKNSTQNKLDIIDVHLSHANYHYLETIKDDPFQVANHIKRVLREMAEPLCTYKLYPQFKDVN